MESYKPVLNVCPRAHLSGTSHQHAHLTAAHLCKQGLLFLIGVCVVDKGYFALWHPASDELFLDVIIDAETFAGRREVAENELSQLLVRTVLPNLEHVVHALIYLSVWLIGQKWINNALVESEFTAVVGDSEHIVHAWVNLPGVYLARALGKSFYERLLYLRGLRHFVVVHNLGLG